MNLCTGSLRKSGTWSKKILDLGRFLYANSGICFRFKEEAAVLKFRVSLKIVRDAFYSMIHQFNRFIMSFSYYFKYKPF